MTAALAAACVPPTPRPHHRPPGLPAAGLACCAGARLLATHLSLSAPPCPPFLPDSPSPSVYLLDCIDADLSARTLDAIKPALEDPSILKVGHSTRRRRGTGTPLPRSRHRPGRPAYPGARCIGGLSARGSRASALCPQPHALPPPGDAWRVELDGPAAARSWNTAGNLLRHAAGGRPSPAPQLRGPCGSGRRLGSGAPACAARGQQLLQTTSAFRGFMRTTPLPRCSRPPTSQRSCRVR